MKSSRLFQIVYLLLGGGTLAAPQLARRLEVSVRTVYRDVEALCQAGVPIAAERGQGGGFRLMEGWVLDRAVMSADEREQLLLAVQALSRATGESGELLEKLGALFRSPQPCWLSVDLTRWGHGGGAGDRFGLIRTAILERRELAFRYVSAGGAQERTVRPARLCFKSSAWYLQAFCMRRMAWRTFKLTRMMDLRLTGGRFADELCSPPIDPAGEGSDTREIALLFPADAAFRVYDEFEPDAVRAGADGSLTVTARMPVAGGWLYGYLLSFGGAAEVLSPAEVRDGLARFARRALARYAKDLCCSENMTRDDRFDLLSCSRPPEDQKNEQEAVTLEQKVCQSCGMPLTGAALELGTEKDGTLSPDYCAHCYRSGAFAQACTMEEMIAFCAPIMARSTPGLSDAEAAERMRAFFPRLKRWK